MRTIKNIKGVETKIFAETFEYDALEQVKKMANFEAYQDSKIRIMPDAHAGKGCTVGTTMVITDKVTPALVGVDIGCVDLHTEFLTEKGWEKISNYNKGVKIAVYDLKNNSTSYEIPENYIKVKNEYFFHLKTKYGIDQMLTKEHTCLVEKGNQNKLRSRGVKYIITAGDLYKRHSSLKNGFRDNFISEIPNLQLKSSCKMTDDEIRVQVMIMADGRIENKRCYFRFKKKRKIERCIYLLTKAGIKYTIKVGGDGVTNIRIAAKCIEKRISFFWNCNLAQLLIICDEVMKWDAAIKDNVFTSVYKKDVDFVQYCFAVNGYRTSIYYDGREGKKSYRCIVSDSRPRVQIAGSPKKEIEIVKSVDGFKYCFTTSTGFWIMRRNGCICITGNCGMNVIKIKKDTVVDYKTIDEMINAKIPSGFSVHENAKASFDLSKLKCRDKIDLARAEKSLGSLGGGNHFIELAKSADGSVYLVIHSGSRKLGGDVCKHYQDLAFQNANEMGKVKDLLVKRLKAEGREKEIANELKKVKKPVTDRDLAYLTGSDFDNYMNDMAITQQYASLNRKTMADIIMKEMGWREESHFESIHNYIDFKRMILRKGAASAEEGELLIIPMNMRDGSLLCIGKGNEDWNYSAPHGAGRLMSRTKAKEFIDMKEFSDSMKDVYTTSVLRSTLDEAPQAYKPIDEIRNAIVDTVSIIETIKPIYNFKAH